MIGTSSLLRWTPSITTSHWAMTSKGEWILWAIREDRLCIESLFHPSVHLSIFRYPTIYFAAAGKKDKPLRYEVTNSSWWQSFIVVERHKNLLAFVFWKVSLDMLGEENVTSAGHMTVTWCLLCLRGVVSSETSWAFCGGRRVLVCCSGGRTMNFDSGVNQSGQIIAGLHGDELEETMLIWNCPIRWCHPADSSRLLHGDRDLRRWKQFPQEWLTGSMERLPLWRIELRDFFLSLFVYLFIYFLYFYLFFLKNKRFSLVLVSIDHWLFKSVHVDGCFLLKGWYETFSNFVK